MGLSSDPIYILRHDKIARRWFMKRARAFDKNLEDLRKFVKSIIKLPYIRFNREKNEARLENFHRRYKSHPEVSEIIKKYRRRKKSGPQS